MAQKPLTMKDLREQVTNDVDKNGEFKNSLSIPGVPDLEKYMEDLETPEEKTHFRKLVQRKVLNDVFPSNKQAVIDEPLRNKIIAKNSIRVEPQCNVCKSPYYTVYMEWLTVDNKGATECSALAKIVFNENISLKSFLNHKKNHLMHPNLIRKAMIRQDPDADPIREGTALIQMIMDEITVDEDVNIKKAKIVKDLIKVVTDAENKREKIGNVEGNLNVTQINIDSGLPRSSHSVDASQRMLTDDERAKLDELQRIFEGRGTGAIRKKIPEKPHEVRKETTEIKDIVFEE